MAVAHCCNQQAQQIQEADQWGWTWPGASAISRARKQRGGAVVSSFKHKDPSYGWSLRAPPRGTARHTLILKCRSNCSLMPDTEGFPVCVSNCKFDCGCILAAYRRAKQYKYPQVAEQARLLAMRQNCLLNRIKCFNKHVWLFLKLHT